MKAGVCVLAAAALCGVAAAELPQATKASTALRPINTFAPAQLSPVDVTAKAIAPRAGAAVATAPSSGMLHTLKIGVYFFLWYAFNVVYNLTNKQVLNALPLPWTISAAQLGIGLLYVFPVWLLKLGGRKAPVLTMENVKTLMPIATCHTTGHLCTVISLSAGSVSFTHIVKAAEPFFSTVMSAVFLKSFFKLPVYLTLIPIVVGVAMASLKELSFTWVSFLNAMASNTAFSMRAIFSKKQMNAPMGENMSAPNLYAVLTIMSFLGLAPLAGVIEGRKIGPAWDSALSAGLESSELTKKILMSGLSYYLYNEVAFLALNAVHPITHAVGNTIKRVVIIVASVIFFKTKMSMQSIIGSSIAIFGVLLYSLAKQYFP
uniref:Sugar phosphate transporter domain-containing protein n=1 Tax=Phaeomonas parva TaxID=124430 RepID=A0A7S1XYR7_9STRA|mmetsp:Transcript_9694/g.28436  ORF Transcript_9694/g.28436 Transcript_9694/m.28436 type:complete len:375 (+) Transcript_9694:121-1245(+)|eukprot:CAMPEP_0118855430 /NCGR_PEP_ID=MMETSP1163-20130328/3257_1 /TAXON_ID=124430 /ORGANISM="Phaeomonas parva, Strain CCMP2877" /LENGTH=374 /DNA_ID=CAMNT_0006788315 /DNA_START=86 /DNA_END=1210 /DNA_ORIENTATION=-